MSAGELPTYPTGRIGDQRPMGDDQQQPPSVDRARSSVVGRRSSVLRRRSSVVRPPSAVFRPPSSGALRIQVRGIVQGVGFRPFVYRIARGNGLTGWVLNAETGVEIHAEGPAAALAAFLRQLESEPPPAARIASIEAVPAAVEGHSTFLVRESQKQAQPTVRISPDLRVCGACVRELFDPGDRRYQYPYVNCTDCGPRYSIVLRLPYDRPRTTMKDWPLCAACAREYDDPLDRRFHAQPVACPECGPTYVFQVDGTPLARGAEAIAAAAEWLRNGKIVAVKGLGGYHLACDADDAAAVWALRERKFRNEKPFALMVPDVERARRLVRLSPEGEALLTAAARPIVLAPRRGDELASSERRGGAGRYAATAPSLVDDGRGAGPCAPTGGPEVAETQPAAGLSDSTWPCVPMDSSKGGDEAETNAYPPRLGDSVGAHGPVPLLDGVAPGNEDLGVMLAYTPVHHLLFAAGAPSVVVMTSANRSDEPIAYEDADAFDRLGGVADAFLVGERPIARRVDDSVARVTPFGPTVLRRARGYAPAAVATLPTDRPVLALGADLKNTVTLVVGGQAFVSQHLGDLEHYAAFTAFRQTIADLRAMYEVSPDELLVVHDQHPEYVSSRYAGELPGEHRAVQHHRAHVASVLAERGAWETRVIGFAFDGTGYGDDGSIWGGEVFVGSLRDGQRRVAHLRPAVLPGGDAAARFPPQAAAGFLAQLDELPDLTEPPFGFPERYRQALQLVRQGVRTFPTTSMGRLFDTVAALVGFTRAITFEGQAAIWLEQRARASGPAAPYPFPVRTGQTPGLPLQMDFRPMLEAVIADRRRGRDVAEIAGAVHEAIARAVIELSVRLGEASATRHVVLSGGVFQNSLLLERIKELLDAHPELEVWVNREVPPNDGGISLGQAALVGVE